MVKATNRSVAVLIALAMAASAVYTAGKVMIYCVRSGLITFEETKYPEKVTYKYTPNTKFNLSNVQYLNDCELTDEDLINIVNMLDDDSLCGNLQTLDLSGNNISDISPLAELKGLKVLYLGNNSISDLSPLAELENLEVLYLYNNKIDDITPLAGLDKLEELHLYDNQITDISPMQ